VPKFKIDILSKLLLAQKQKSAGEKGKTLKQVMVKIREIIDTIR
jgi:hypothetical protein